MCMEDVRNGRESTAAMVTFTSVTGSTPTIPGDPMRKSLMLGYPSSGRITWMADQTAVLDGGITLSPTSGIVELRVEDWGSLVTGPWTHIASGGGACFWAYSRLEKK